jgi:protein-L-isoaspartate(D-aspartate) O-methyltransferase
MREVTIVADRSPAEAGADNPNAALKAMIDSQLRTSGINADWILRRMSEVPRERFVPEAARGHAYIDRAIDLGNGRKLAAPVVQGLMLQEAKPAATDNALIVESGSGYLAELLRPLVGSLETITPAEAAAKARKKGDISLLVIDGAIEQLPGTLASRLAEGGRVVTGLVNTGITRLAIGRKAAGEIGLLPLAEVGIPVLPEFAAPRRWSF